VDLNTQPDSIQNQTGILTADYDTKIDYSQFIQSQSQIDSRPSTRQSETSRCQTPLTSLKRLS